LLTESRHRWIGLPLESQLAGPFPYDFTATDVPVRFAGKGLIADRLLIRPAPFNVPARDELERALKHFRHEKDRSRGKGSQEKWTGPDERAFTLPKRDPVSGHVFRAFLQQRGDRQDHIRPFRSTAVVSEASKGSGPRAGVARLSAARSSHGSDLKSRRAGT
jgi:hypothetical protein